jgi:hypothetical protein
MPRFVPTLIGLAAMPALALAQNQPPVAIAAADRTTIIVGDQVCFDASQSHDPELGPLTYRWTYVHGILSTEITFCRLFTTAGDYTIALRVTDDAGQSDLDFITITVESPKGACCVVTACTLTTQTACTGTFQGIATTCGEPGNPTTCCPANFNRSGGLSVQDIFDFLAAYFSNCTAPANPPCYATADFNGSGVISVQDIFDFLAAYFTGCP